MTQYVMFQSTQEIEEAIRVGYVLDLTPNEVYEVVGGSIIDDDGCDICIVLPEYDLTCPQLRGLAQWQYCDADGNLL